MTNLNKLPLLSRRQLMSATAKSALGVVVGANYLLGDANAGMPNNEMRLIMLYMSGGMSHLDTFDPQPGFKESGPAKPISTSGDARISEHLKELAPHMDQFAVINSMRTTQGAHGKGNYYMHTGYVKRGTIVHPTLGAWGMYHHGKINPSLPGNVVISPNSGYPYAGFMAPELGALPIGSPSAGLQNSRMPEWADEEKFHKQLKLAKTFDET